MRFYLSGNLMRFTDYDREIDVEADTVHAAIMTLVDHYPALKPVLLDRGQDVRTVHQIFCDGEVILPEHLHTKVAPDADITILTALAGG